MDGTILGLFLVAAFLGGFASGLAGFAMGFVVSGIWLHLITPIQTAALIAGYGLWTQGYGVWKLRRSLSWRSVAPFIIGGTIGVPIGTMLLTYIDPAYMRGGVGLLLIAYSIYGFAQPKLKSLQAGVPADGGIGFLNGLLCGLTGLPGFIITIWCQLRGWTKDVQRAVFQPVMLAAIVMTTVSLGVSGAVTADTVKLYFLGLPALLSGLSLGFKLYGRLNDAAFRKLILLLLFVSGLALIAAQGLPIVRAGTEGFSARDVPSALPSASGPLLRGISTRLDLRLGSMEETRPGNAGSRPEPKSGSNSRHSLTTTRYGRP